MSDAMEGTRLQPKVISGELCTKIGPADSLRPHFVTEASTAGVTSWPDAVTMVRGRVAATFYFHHFEGEPFGEIGVAIYISDSGATLHILND